MKIILASKSNYKRQQLSQIGLKIECVSPEVIEDHELSTDIEQLAILLAQQKAEAVFQKHPDAIVIGSDQTATTNEQQLLTKPNTKENAIKQLKRCSDSIVTFNSGMSVIYQQSRLSWSVATKVHFRRLSIDEIKRYIDKDQPLDCAGSFKVEALGISLFQKIESEDPSALIGLPLISLCHHLRRHGIQIP